MTDAISPLHDSEPAISQPETLHAVTVPAESALSAVASGTIARQMELMAAAAALLILAGVAWSLLHSASLSFRQTVRRARQASASAPLTQGLANRIRVLAQDASTVELLREWQTAADAASQRMDFTELRRISQQMLRLLDQLSSAYELLITGESPEQIGFVRASDAHSEDREYFLVVSARTAQGRPYRCQIQNPETKQVESVDRWAERVPKAVYDRILAAAASGRLNDQRQFAVKETGDQSLRVRLLGSDQHPLERMGQLVHWDEDGAMASRSGNECDSTD